MSIFPAAVQRATVNNQADMHRLAANPGDEDPALIERGARLPENDISVIARHEVAPGFVIHRLVNFDPHNVAVIEHHQAPAVSSVKAAGAVTPGDALNPRDEVVFKHSGAPDILRRCTAARRCD